jgi:gluconolactonase
MRGGVDMIFAEHLSIPEGPVFLPDGCMALVEMGRDRGAVTHVSADGKTRTIMARSGRPNGLALDKEGNLWLAESLPASLVRLKLGNCYGPVLLEYEVVLTECDGESFLFPNDLAFGPDGALYLTDSGIAAPDCYEDFSTGKIRSDFMEMKTDGRVYRIETEKREIEKLDSGIQFTNGIAFGPDNSLYINESLTGNVFKYPWENGKIINQRKLFANVWDKQNPALLKAPDGMKFGNDGFLYCTVAGQGDVIVLGSNGEWVDQIKTQGQVPSNLVFGPNGEKKIYITEDENGTVEVHTVDTNGLQLYG